MSSGFTCSWPTMAGITALLGGFHGSQDRIEGTGRRGRSGIERPLGPCDRTRRLRAHPALRAASKSRQFRPDLGHAICRAQCRRAGLGYALRRRFLASAAAADGRVRGSDRRWHHLDVQIATGPQIPRWRTGAEQGRRCEPDALGGTRPDGADAQGSAAGAHRCRRSHLQMGAEAAVPEDALRAWQEQFALRLHHAGAHCADRPVQADWRLCRLGADEVRQG